MYNMLDITSAKLMYKILHYKIGLSTLYQTRNKGHKNYTSNVCITKGGHSSRRTYIYQLTYIIN
jgi:hypothetical protein